MEVRFLSSAIADLSSLDSSAMRRVVKRISWMESNFDNIQHESLSGDLSELFKLRAGDYRILYQIVNAENAILIHQIGHRRQIYRQK